MRKRVSKLNTNQFRTRGLTSLWVTIAISIVLVGAVRLFSPQANVIVAPTAAQADETATIAPTTAPSGSNCSDGELRVGDLKMMDTEWQAQQPNLVQAAKAWEQDAFMTGVRVGCDILESGFRWQGTFYSPSAQAFFLTDTAEIRGADFDPKDAVELPNTFSFGAIWRTLAKAGFGDDTILSPSTGVTIQVNSKATPFGPSDVPANAIVCHVALEYLGEVRDLFITLPDGTVYRHAFP
jgi:hypothetical protein